MRTYKVSLYYGEHYQGSYIESKPQDMYLDYIGLDIGDSYKIECIEIDEKDLDALPEFDGF